MPVEMQAAIALYGLKAHISTAEGTADQLLYGITVAALQAHRIFPADQLQ